MRWVMSAALVAILVAQAVSTRADDMTVPLASVPAAARKAVEKAVPGIKLKEASKAEDDGKVIYELAGADAKGREVAVEVTDKGEVLSISWEVALKDVPKVVLAALAKKLKDFKPMFAWEVNVDGKLVAYGFEGKNSKGEDMEVSVTPDGSKVEVEDGGKG
jgi:uncharacterized protein YpmB